MRVMLGAALVCSLLIGSSMTSAAAAVGKAKARSDTPKAKTVPVEHKGKAPAVQRVTAKSATTKLVTVKSKSVSPGQHGVTPLARQGKATLRADKSEALHLTRTSKLVPAAKVARVAHVVQRRNVNRVFASNIDLWQEPGQLAVHSGSALVIAQDGSEPLYEKNANAIVPIASITKVMTAMVVLDSLPNLQAPITIGDEDVDYLRGSRSRLHVGSVLTRETALLLALMSSENRAANALARHYPGGLPAFVAAMNRKAVSLGMNRTHFEDPTGLNSNNVSTAHDLARMVAAAHRYPLIREFSTTPGTRTEINGRELEFHNTNQLVSSPTWEIGLSKTGYIQEAGKCLVMQARVAEKPVVIVLLDATGKQTRIGDANRIKRWIESAAIPGRQPSRA